MQNSTYAWTKALAAFFVVSGLWFYLAGWRKNDSRRIVDQHAGGEHYKGRQGSAGPYVVLLARHYIAGACGLLLATWFGWSAAVYGVRATLASNAAITSSQEYQGNGVVKIALNLYDTIVPAQLRGPAILNQLDQPDTLGMLRDRFLVW